MHRTKRPGGTGRHRWLALASGVVLGVSLLAPTPQVALAANCPIASHPAMLDDADANVAYDGVKMIHTLRDMVAPDYNTQFGWGHAATSLWVGTNGDILNNWVEIGVSQGWRGTNALVYYAAHRTTTITYIDFQLTGTPVIANNVVFQVTREGSQFKAQVNDLNLNTFTSRYFDGHALPIDKYWIGGEWTCPGGSRINRTYINTNKVRRSSDGVWINATSGVKNPDPPFAGADLAWCSQPVTFIFYYRPLNGTTGCG